MDARFRHGVITVDVVVAGGVVGACRFRKSDIVTWLDRTRSAMVSKIVVYSYDRSNSSSSLIVSNAKTIAVMRLLETDDDNHTSLVVGDTISEILSPNDVTSPLGRQRSTTSQYSV